MQVATKFQYKLLRNMCVTCNSTNVDTRSFSFSLEAMAFYPKFLVEGHIHCWYDKTFLQQ